MRDLSIAACTALLDNFNDSALVSSSDLWTSVDIHQGEHIYSNTAKRYKSVRSRLGHDESTVVSNTVVPGEFPKHFSRPAKGSRIDFS